MVISIERDSPTGQEMTADAEEIIIEALRDLACWLYRQLEREYDTLISDGVASTSTEEIKWLGCPVKPAGAVAQGRGGAA